MNESKKCKNDAKYFFANMRNAKISIPYFCKNKISAKKSVVAATINCAKKLVEFSALRAQHLKFYFIIFIISLPVC